MLIFDCALLWSIQSAPKLRLNKLLGGFSSLHSNRKSHFFTYKYWKKSSECPEQHLKIHFFSGILSVRGNSACMLPSSVSKASLDSPVHRFCIEFNIIREVPNFILGNALQPIYHQLQSNEIAFYERRGSKICLICLALLDLLTIYLVIKGITHPEDYSTFLLCIQYECCLGTWSLFPTSAAVNTVLCNSLLVTIISKRCSKWEELSVFHPLQARLKNFLIFRNWRELVLCNQR